MANTKFQIIGSVGVLNPYPVDDRYGPFSSISEALLYNVPARRFPGLTVGITTGGATQDYAWQNDLTDAGLILKVDVPAILAEATQYAAANVIGSATPSSSPTGTETNGQSYRVDNKTGAILVFPNFLDSGSVAVQMAADERSGYITKNADGWVYVDNTAEADLSGYTPNGGSLKTTLQVDKKDQLLEFSVNSALFVFDNSTGKLSCPNIAEITLKSGIRITLEGGEGVGLSRITNFIVCGNTDLGRTSNVYVDIPLSATDGLNATIAQNYQDEMPPIADGNTRLLLGLGYTVSATIIDFYSDKFGIYANTGIRKKQIQLTIESNKSNTTAITTNATNISANTAAIAANAASSATAIAEKLSHDYILGTGINIFNKTIARRGGFLLPDGITWHVQAGYDVSDFMKVEQGQTYCIGGDTGSYDQYAWSYKADKTLHTYYVTPGNPIPRKFVPAADEVFLKTTTLTASYDTFMVAQSTTYPVSYIPYTEYIKPQFLPNPLPIVQNPYDLGAIDLQIPITDWVDLADYGQSLSTGQQAYPSLTVLNFRGNKMIGSQVWLNYSNDGASILNDLISKRATLSIGLPQTRTAASQDEPFIISFANSAKLLADRMAISNKSIFVANSTGTDGKSIEQLLLDTYYNIFKNKLIKLKAMADTAVKTVSCPIIIFVQGEYNYYELAGSSDKDTYKANCLILKNKMQTDVKNIYGQVSLPLFMTYQTTGPYTHNNECSIGMAQLEFALENNDCAIVCPSYNFSNRGAHLDANGYRWMGQQFAKAWAKILRGEKFLPLYPTRVIKENDTQIRVLFFVPVAPLVFDSQTVTPITNNGFYVYNESGELAISTVIINGDSVLITLAVAMTGTVKVAYASQTRTGRGNLRDSDKAISMYNYIDLDAKDGGGNFIYPRDTGETTLRPDFEPKDGSGLVIYNKPYPLYNFCVAFSMPVLY